jgi:Domain of unknown function (DUF4864)
MMKTLLKWLMSPLFVLLLGVTLHAAEPSVTQKQAMQAAISAQLDAFNADRDADAYAQAAPAIKNYFPTIESFLSMVKRGYGPVYRHKSYSFGSSFADHAGRNAQRVIIDAADGKRYEALYTLELQPDGSWKISGCTLLEIAATDV